MLYSIIYADPPWRMISPRLVYTPYETMSDEQIINMPVKDIASENCALFMWSISSRLPVAIEACKSWGFTYKTIAFNWVKTSMATGQPNCRIGTYTLQGSEICLLGIRGKLQKKSNKVRQVFMSPRATHSKKPDEFRNRIVDLYGDLPRIELFARSQTQGWDVFGNEVEGSIRLLTTRAADAESTRR
jgi:N6-adenosine-specific RNA methylase IME4